MQSRRGFVNLASDFVNFEYASQLGPHFLRDHFWLRNLHYLLRLALLDVVDHGLERVLLLDWDVHHGNGTQQIFEDDPNVLYLSLHKLTPQFFPGTGEATDAGSGPGLGDELGHTDSKCCLFSPVSNALAFVE